VPPLTKKAGVTGESLQYVLPFKPSAYADIKVLQLASEN